MTVLASLRSPAPQNPPDQEALVAPPRRLPWTLKPTSAALLNALASHFIDSGYDLKAPLGEIVNSSAYQLSSRYPGQWDPAWRPYFARKFVRLLWAEEVVDTLAQSSGLAHSYTVTGFTDQGFAMPSYAMRLPEASNTPNGDVNLILDNFLRGDRDNQPRKQDGSILQPLDLMNNRFVESRLVATGTAAAPLIANNLTLSNSDLINAPFLNILFCYPTSDETTKAQTALGGPDRTQAVQDLVWWLYNKVDFVFNY